MLKSAAKNKDRYFVFGTEIEIGAKTTIPLGVFITGYNKFSKPCSEEENLNSNRQLFADASTDSRITHILNAEYYNSELDLVEPAYFLVTNLSKIVSIQYMKKYKQTAVLINNNTISVKVNNGKI
jgi:hypothetical protein